MTTVTYTFDHYMDGRSFAVTRVITVTARRGGVAIKRYGKTTFLRARFPRLLAWQIGRALRREGYARADADLYAEWAAVRNVRGPADRVPYAPFGEWLEARSARRAPRAGARS
jgi:hypothetical protein